MEHLSPRELGLLCIAQNRDYVQKGLWIFQNKKVDTMNEMIHDSNIGVMVLSFYESKGAL